MTTYDDYLLNQLLNQAQQLAYVSDVRFCIALARCSQAKADYETAQHWLVMAADYAADANSTGPRY